MLINCALITKTNTKKILIFSTEAADGIVKIGKVDGYYSHPEPGKELLIINGPLDDDIILFVSNIWILSQNNK